MSSRTWTNESLSGLSGLLSQPGSTLAPADRSLLILLHGVRSNERDLIPVGAAIAPDSIILSLRAPLPLAPDGFGWFNVDFSSGAPVHDWAQAKESLDRLDALIGEASRKYGVPTERILMLGFSQGAILTLGMALQGEHRIGGYIACSGRTLPEVAAAAKGREQELAHRPIFLAHGTQDAVLPLFHAQKTREILSGLHASVTYREYPMGHSISEQQIRDVGVWVRERLHHAP